MQVSVLESRNIIFPLWLQQWHDKCGIARSPARHTCSQVTLTFIPRKTLIMICAFLQPKSVLSRINILDPQGAWEFKLCIYCHPCQEQTPMKSIDWWSLLESKTSSIVLHILASATPHWNVYTLLFTGPSPVLGVAPSLCASWPGLGDMKIVALQDLELYTLAPR